MVAFVFFNQRQSDQLRDALAVIEERQVSLEQSNDRYRKLFDILSAQETRSIHSKPPTGPRSAPSGMTSPASPSPPKDCRPRSVVALSSSGRFPKKGLPSASKFFARMKTIAR